MLEYLCPGTGPDVLPLASRSARPMPVKMHTQTKEFDVIRSAFYSDTCY